MNSDNLFAGNRVDRNENKDDIGISEKQTILNCDIDDHSKASLGSKGVKSMLSMFESLSCKTQQGVLPLTKEYHLILKTGKVCR